MHVVSGSRNIFLKSEQHVDTHSLVWLHHAVEHVIGRIEEYDGTEREQHYVQIVDDAAAQPLIQKIQQKQHTERQLNPYYVKRYHENGEKSGKQRYSEHIKKYEPRLLAVFTIDVNHQCGEDVHKQEHDILAHRCGRLCQEHLLVFYSHHEIDHHRNPREQYAAGHAFAIEHKEERQINQRRTCLTLSDDEEHRHENDGAGSREMLPSVYIESKRTHHFSQGKGRGKLSELGRLQSQRTDDNP